MIEAKIPGGYYIKARKIATSTVAHCAPVVREVFDYIIRSANRESKKYNGYRIERGQTFRQISEIQEGLHWKSGFRKETYKSGQIKRAISTLVEMDIIISERKPRGLLITVINYSFYQDPKNYKKNDSPEIKSGHSWCSDGRHTDRPMGEPVDRPMGEPQQHGENSIISNNSRKFSFTDEPVDRPMGEPTGVTRTSSERLSINKKEKKERIKEEEECLPEINETEYLEKANALYRSCFNNRGPTPGELDKIEMWFKDFGVKKVITAFDEAIPYRPKNLVYVQNILIDKKNKKENSKNGNRLTSGTSPYVKQTGQFRKPSSTTKFDYSEESNRKLIDEWMQ